MRHSKLKQKDVIIYEKYKRGFLFLIENEYEDTTLDDFIYFYTILCNKASSSTQS